MRLRLAPSLAAVGVALALATTSCARTASQDVARASNAETTGWDTRPRGADDVVVAKVDGVPIFGSQVAVQMRATGTDARAALDALVGWELLAAKARRDGHAEVNPETNDLVRRAAVQRLLAVELERNDRPEDIPDATLRARYEENREYFVHGRVVEALFFAYMKGFLKQPGEVERARAAARELLRYMREHPDATDAHLIALRGDPRWQDPSLQVFHRKQNESRPFSRTVGRAVLALQRPGDLTDLVEDDTGIFIARFRSAQEPKNVTYEQAKPELLAKYHPVWRQERFRDLLGRVERKHGVKVFAERAALLRGPRESASQ